MACRRGNTVAKSLRVWIWLGLLGALAAIMGCETMMYPSYPPPPPPPVAAPPPPSRLTLYVNASRLNLRACPGMDCPRVATLERNEEVEKVAETEDWVQVRVKRDGTIGWVANPYLSDRPVPVEMAPATPTPATPEAGPPAAAAPERPKPAKPSETVLPRPAPKPAEAAEPGPEPAPVSEPETAPEKPAPAEKPVETPAPVKPQPEPEPPKKIRIM
jgi:hypothetical protein